MPRESKDMLYGSLDLLILRSLASQPLHGYAVSNFIRQRTAGALEIVDAALYKGLHRLERRGLIAGTWGHTEENRQAKFYALTAAGRAELRTETRAWRRYVTVVDKVLAPG